jgi:cardiolipin synthase A/B
MTAMVRTIVENFSLIAAVLAAFYVLAAVCAVREVMASRTSQGSIAWLLSLAFLPFPTAIIYMVFGWKHFDSYTRTRHKIRHNRILRAEDLKVIDREAGKAWPVLIRAAGMPFTDGNRTELLIDGHATFDSIFARIAEAEQYVLVQFYIVRDDALGQRLADVLIERARAGVAVYLLYDDVGSSGLPRPYRERLRAAGVNVSAFNQRHGFIRLFGPMRINYRNHRKNVVVDGKVAWAGGSNIGIEYLGEDPKVGDWRDTQIMIEGPAAQAFALVFREDWSWATGDDLDLIVPEKLNSPGDASALLMATGPADKFEACAIAFTDMIAQARTRLWVVSPYFVPDTDVRTALYAAQLRGVDVRLMLPANPDQLLVGLATTAHADAMVHHGISVYRYTKGFLHQKILLVDDVMASVGSVNFDNRSFAINFELTLWLPGADEIAAVETMLNADFKNCALVTRDEVEKRGFPMRFVTQAAKLLSPIL